MKISPNQIEEGMIFARDVFDINYRLLIPQGEKVQPHHIRILKIWGVQEVEIVGTEQALRDMRSEISRDAVEEARKAVGHIFQYVDIEHPAIKEIYRLSVWHRSKDNHFRHLIKTQAEPVEARRFDSQIPIKIRANNIKLPETPLIISELKEMIDNPYASASDIAKVVNKSTSLSALLLRIVNSAFYNFPEKIDSISWAVTLIGTKEIVNLAFGISVMEVFTDIPREIIDVQSFIRHSLFCGILSRILGAHKNLVQTEQLFVSGLLHDIGRLVVYKYYPKESLALLALTDQLGRPLYRIEKEMGGIRHTHVGYYLMKKWHLPHELVDTIFHHHSPSQGIYSVKPGIVHMADIITTGLGIGNSGERFVPAFDEAAWNSLSVSPGLFESAVKQALHQLKFLGIFSQG
ncbi:MAG: HDOD domain-containing protein [Desulfobacterales bacterium]|nr:HDOD domain-containing protein [Desulfobacterales bacterium]